MREPFYTKNKVINLFCIKTVKLSGNSIVGPFLEWSIWPRLYKIKKEKYAFK
jgi:hypothetical protein